MNSPKAQIAKQITKIFPDILLNEPLKLYTTFRIGGPADYFYKLQNYEVLPKLTSFARANKIPYFFIGAGSNVLFDDKGFRGLVIKMEANTIRIKDSTITADSGALISNLVQKSLEQNLSGLENWIGLPGTVGGAVYGNAGCNGLETKDVLKEALIFNIKTGKTRRVFTKYFNFKYRDSKLKKSSEILLNATFKLKKAKTSSKEREKTMEELKNTRYSKQPAGLTCGSFFKNPSPDKSAGLLIEKVGLKGKIMGKAKISEKHGNFILNTGNAASKDVLTLAKLAQRLVKAKFGIKLEPEVQIISPFGKAKL